jgi:hypothetical protein
MLSIRSFSICACVRVLSHTRVGRRLIVCQNNLLNSCFPPGEEPIFHPLFSCLSFIWVWCPRLSPLHPLGGRGFCCAPVSTDTLFHAGWVLTMAPLLVTVDNQQALMAWGKGSFTRPSVPAAPHPRDTQSTPGKPAKVMPHHGIPVHPLQVKPCVGKASDWLV